jgi:hypothetical protein
LYKVVVSAVLHTSELMNVSIVFFGGFGFPSNVELIMIGGAVVFFV